MRALTIYRPEAELIATGAKTIETRPRPWSYRGPLLIHAAYQRLPPPAPHPRVRAPEVVALAHLVDCRPFTPHDLPASQLPQMPQIKVWSLCLVGLRPLPGRIHWLGKQGLWRPDGELQELVADSLSPWGEAAAAAADEAHMALTWRDGLWRVHPPGQWDAKPRFDASLDPGLIGRFNLAAVQRQDPYRGRLNGGNTVVVCSWTGHDADRAYRAIKNLEEGEDVHDKRRAQERRYSAYSAQRLPAEADGPGDDARGEGADAADRDGAGGGDEPAADGGAPRLGQPKSPVLGRPGGRWVEAFAHVRGAPAARGARAGAGGAADPGDAESLSRGGELMRIEEANERLRRPPAGEQQSAQEAEVALAKRIRAADAAFGAGADYDRDRVTAEVRHHLGQGALAMLEAGRRLCWLRDREPHGEWLPLLERIGIHDRAARRMMLAARKFGDGPNRTLVSDLSVTKVYELTAIPDEDLGELREGGTVAGLTLDDVDRMAPSELRAALRAERKERRDRADAQGKVAAARRRRIDELEEANSRLRSPHRVRWSEAAVQRLGDVYTAKSEIARHADEMHAVLRWLIEHSRHVDPRAGRYAWNELAAAVDVALERLGTMAEMLTALPEGWDDVEAVMDRLDEMEAQEEGEE